MGLFKKIRLIVLYMILVLIVSCIAFRIYYERQEDKFINEMQNKIKLIEEGLTAAEVINILGKPRLEHWVSTEHYDSYSDEFERIYRLEYYYVIKGFIIFGIPQGVFWEIDLDDKDGKVIGFMEIMGIIN